jgi:hypothetical protein
MVKADTTHDVGRSDASMLGIYLNDHLAGATAGTELAHRMARSHGDGEDSGTLRRLAAEVVQDRAALLDIMATLGIKVHRYKVCAAWIGEKAGRVKFKVISSPGHLSATWKNWKSCGSAWRARPRAGAPCGPWPIRTRALASRAWMSSFPGPGGRQMSSRTSGWPPPAR